MFNRKPTFVLFVDRNRLQLFGSAMSGIVALDVPATILRDLTIINRDELYVVLKQWVKQYAMGMGQVCIILSEAAYFQKIFSVTNDLQLDSEIVKFSDSVPFDSLVTKVYTDEKEHRVVAANKDFIDALVQGFRLQGVAAKAIVPISALGVWSGKRVMDQELGNFIIRNADSVAKQTIADDEDISVHTPPTATPNPSPKKSSLPLLLGVFGVLIGILVLVVVMQMQTTT